MPHKEAEVGTLGFKTPARRSRCIGDQGFHSATKPWVSPHSLVKVSPRLRVPSTSRLPALAEAPVFPRALVPSKALGPVAISKAPLAAQLEAFVRREYKIYSTGNRDCTHVDTLHIVREAFSVFLEHFSEYREVLSLIRDEYEAAFQELLSEVKRLRAVELETSSDRSVHAMEMLKQREAFKSIVSNHYAQLQATEGIVHSLRDQITSYEESNETLRAQLKKAKEETREATDTSKLLTKSMIEEAARNSQLLAARTANEREIGRLKVQVDMVREELKDVESRYTALLEKTLCTGGPDTIFKGKDVRAKKKLDQECEQEAKKKLEESEENARQKASEEEERRNRDNAYFALINERIDELLLEREQLKQQLADALASRCASACGSGGGGRPASTSRARRFSADPGALENDRRLVEGDATYSRLIAAWLREEQMTGAELDRLDVLIPPGASEDHPFGFLKATLPVRNRYLKREDTIDMLNSWWGFRRNSFDSSIKHHFMCWLQKTTGSESGAQELGVNIVHVCEHNIYDPDCRAFLLIFRECVPEDVVHAWTKDIAYFEELCRESMSAHRFVRCSVLYDKLRNKLQEKTYLNMLELRLYLWRNSDANGMISVDFLFRKDSRFLYLLKKQLLREVEEFTLRVVEAIRSVALDADTVKLQDVVNALSAQDPGIPQGTLRRLVAEATQLTSMDVATCGVDFTVRLRPLIYRFRSAVLLRRVTPPVDTSQLNPNIFDAKAIVEEAEEV
ncbi:uncharacterized protein TEOVI_000113900 [Trypanosoma equiperdum]|uniref:Translin-associated factor X-interacting protein 1 N-terminal domain-containing protein n=2 Tax=Trypanozoon TaxID=39700 RepID=Q387F7_TRYB2|nr:hypothetical protein, conserved [Trypanosoma brucei brucei TREU927]EAN79074.1 hypothetical protein, conserved [Trypanosoma brucei brucei TREU927]SCU69573.1 hypothetical protein, conserved [Trypanosoma equiperdum]